jgi:hypothetical protein
VSPCVVVVGAMEDDVGNKLGCHLDKDKVKVTVSKWWYR